MHSRPALDTAVLISRAGWLWCSLAALAICAGLVHAQGADYKTAARSPVGEWHTFGDGGGKPRSAIRITEAGGVYTGRILRSLVPGEDPDKICTKCTDERRDKRLNGMAFLTGMRRLDKGGAVAGENVYGGGEILDPDTGGIYRSSMTLASDGKRLTVRGYLGIPLFGRTQEWLRAD